MEVCRLMPTGEVFTTESTESTELWNSILRVGEFSRFGPDPWRL